MFQIVSVFPVQRQTMKINTIMRLVLTLDREFDDTLLIQSDNDVHFLCQMENTMDVSNRITAYKMLQKSDTTLQVNFRFKDAQANITAANNPCYQLKCMSRNTIGEEVFYPMSIQTQYCFQLQDDDCVRCNPNDFSKCDQGKCVCSYPY